MFSFPPALDGLGALPWILADVASGVAAADDTAVVDNDGPVAPGRGRFSPLGTLLLPASNFEGALL